MTDLICRKSMTNCLTPGMCSPHGGCQTPETAPAFRALLAERNALAFLLKRFVDGEHDQDENQAERHMYHDEAQTLLAYLGGELHGHTLVPDESLRKQSDESERLQTLAQTEIDKACESAKEVMGARMTLHTLDRERNQLRAFAVDMINASFEGGSFDGGDIQDIAVKHGLLAIERREVECGEACACREYGFPAECYRKTPILGAVTDEVATPSANTEDVSRHERR
ncbi:hypothetical protein [Pseudomonas extremaustralis]|uniref:Uncharacterized protein n=1 Tax=Pseudomonas extremaustralis TaxID=359110 RepID=A0A5C5QFP5_9PSED|nr:hypothetical protein [Pseudomonas extremaustralis]EZI28917.1 hypothetical protein PE143B_0109620 [Pseudomonas extremaustralis 14-3 substr. 14-3b]TWS04098.1 hypothetical protein FIV36_14195 [Pseudomonas extremaustralis]SDF59271.1 hypothetical protein SAMN05216591_3403 [Pseudomonas extremaustralis]